MIKKFLFFIFILLMSTLARSQRLSFEHIKVENGLSQNSVDAIAQDNLGFLWFGTRFGVNRYDSHGFKYYQNNPLDNTTISSNSINCIFFDSHKRLWIGTNEGLNRYIAEKDCFEQIKKQNNDSHSISNNHITAICEDKEGKIWIGTANGLNLIIEENGKMSFTHYTVSSTTSGLKNNYIYCLLSDKSGNIWTGTDGGLTKITRNGKDYHYQTYLHSFTNSISENKIRCLIEDTNRNIWIGTANEGVDVLNTQNNGFTHFKSDGNKEHLLNNTIRAFIIDDHNNIWIGTLQGISLLNLATHQFTNYQNNPDDKTSISKNSIHSLFKDRNNDVWVGTFFGGINYSSYNNPLFKSFSKSSFKPSINNNVVSSFWESDDELLMGTEGGGLNYLNKKTNCYQYFTHNESDTKSISSNLIKTIYQDKDGDIWLGTHGGGICLFNNKTKAFTNYFTDDQSLDSLGLEVAAFLDDNEGNLLIGTQNGLKFYKKQKGVSQKISLSLLRSELTKIHIHSLIRDNEKNIWIGTDSGLYCQRFKQKNIESIHLKSEKIIDINGLCTDDKGQIWIATYYSGLICYDYKTQQITSFTQKEGLPSDNVLSVVKDENGDIWAGTNNGLMKFKPKDNSFNIYDINDGLAGNEFNNNSIYRTVKGEVFVGGMDGFTSFFPKDLVENGTKPSIVFTGLRLFNTAIGQRNTNGQLSSNIWLTNEIVLEHNQNIFTIDFATLSYKRSGKNKYAYKIEGKDHDWIYTNTPSATFIDLPSGKYIFKAKGANSDGIWSDPINMNIDILPPWWQTWWAYSIYTLLVSGILFIVIRFFFLQVLYEKEKTLTNLKLNFFTNISHEIHTYLALIIGPVDKLLSSKEATDSDIPQLTTIKNNSTDLLTLVNELLDFRKIETGNVQLHVSNYNLIPFIESVLQSFQDISISKNIVTDFIHATEQVVMYFDKEQVKKVLVNLLSNAYKFTPEGGFVSIIVEPVEDCVLIKICDNGKGISSENLDKLFDNFFQENDYGIQNTGYGIGLALSKSIMALHKGALTVESNHQGTTNNTTFTIMLLKGDTHFAKEQLIVNHQAILQQRHLQTIDNKGLISVKTNLESIDGIQIEKKQFSLLIIEDNYEIRKFIADSFSKLYEVFEAENGLVGYEVAVEQIPDIIISDLMMPIMDGLTLCKKIKTDERTNHIPVIILTAKSSFDSKLSGFKMGADIYINKPFSIQLLELQVQNLISSKERLRQLFTHKVIEIPETNRGIKNEQSNRNIEDGVKEEIRAIEVDEFIQKIITIAEGNISSQELDVDLICKKVNMSRSVLYKKVKALTGMTIHEIIKNVKLKKAAELIAEKKYTVYEVADMIGYNDTKYFSSEFKKKYGVSPTEYAL